jgi:hypothetical protein
MELKTKETQAGQGAARPNSDLEKARRAQEGLPPEAIKPAVVDTAFDLVGIAPTDAEVAQYMNALQKSDLLSDVNLLFSEEWVKPGEDKEKGEKLRRFHVEMKINPNADLRGVSVAGAGPEKWVQQ